jgi:hypothetical protein
MPFLAPAVAAIAGLASTGTWIAIGLTVVSLIMARRAIKQPNIEDNRKNLTVLRGATNPRKIPYGRCRLGGTMVYANTKDVRQWDDTGKSDLFMAIAISPRHIHSFQNLYVNDKDLYWYEQYSLATSWETESNDSVTLYLHRTGSTTMTISGTVNGTALTDVGLCALESELYALGYTVTYHTNEVINAANQVACAGNEDSIRAIHVREIALNQLWDVTIDGAPYIDYKVDPTPDDWYFPLWNGATKTFDTYQTTEAARDAFVKTDGGYTYYVDEEAFGETTYHVNRPVWVDTDGLWYYAKFNDITMLYTTLTREYNPEKVKASTPNTFHFTGFTNTRDGVTIDCTIGATHGILKYEMNNGERIQQPSVMLREHFPGEWTVDHRGNGVANLVTHVFYDHEQLPNGVPNYSVEILGVDDIIDPMAIGVNEDLTDKQALRDKIGIYTTNGVSVLMDYLLSPEGLNCTLDEIDIDNFAAEAAVADEIVDLLPSVSGLVVGVESNPISGNSTRITITDHGFTSYNLVRIEYAGETGYAELSVVDEDTILAHGTTSLLSGGETVTCTLCQRRYTIDGPVDTSIEPSGVIDSMLVHLGYGSLTFDNGKYKVKTGHYTLPVAEITEDWIITDVVVRPRASRDALFNAVKGTYISRYKNWEVTDFEAYENPTYCQEDNQGVACTVNDYIHQEVQYPFVTEPVRAKRLAKLYLEKHRQYEQLDLVCNLKAYKLDVGDNVTVTISDLGFSSKVFEVIKWTLNTDSSISLSLKETASAVYDWAYGDYTAEDLAINTFLPTTTWANQFDSVDLATAAYIDTAGNLKEKIVVTAVMNPDYNYAFRASTEVQYRDLLETGSEWMNAYSGESLTCDIDGVKMSHYAVRVRGTHPTSPPTEWYYKDIETQGAGSLITRVGMPKPVNPQAYFSIENNRIDRMRFRIDTGDGAGWTSTGLPDFLIFMYTMEQHPNVLNILDNNLVVSSVDVISSGTMPVLDDGGNTLSKIKLWEDPIDADTDVAGMWWMRIDSPVNGYSKFVKVDWYDGTYIYLARDLLFVPTTGDTLEFWELPWGDVREDEFKLSVITDGTDYEVIKWEDLQYNAGLFSFLGVTRQAEDSSSLDATGKELSYYPAPGPGTAFIIVPATSFVEVTGGYESSFEVDIKIPEHTDWAAITVMFGRMSIEQGLPVLIRSPIVPLIYKGSI